MGLKKLAESYVDYNKISYIGPLDTIVKAHINVTLNFFLIVTEGHPVEIHGKSKKAVNDIREKLIQELKQTDGYLPA